MERKKEKKKEKKEAKDVLEELDDLYLDFIQYEHIHSALRGAGRAVELRHEMRERIEKGFPEMAKLIRERGMELTLADKMKLAELSQEFQDAVVRGRLFHDNDLYRDPVYAKTVEDLSLIFSDGVFCRSIGDMRREGDLGERKKRYRQDDPELTDQEQEELGRLGKRRNEYRKYKEKFSRFPVYFTAMRDEPWTIRFEKEAESRIFDYVPFDPDIELKKISCVRKSGDGNVVSGERAGKKRDMLIRYKENLMRQKEGIAELQVALQRAIRENPEIQIRELKEIIYQKAPACRLTWPQISAFFDGAKKYVRKHEKINEYCEKYPAGEDLFRVCFGFEPKGKIEFIKGNVTIHFFCLDEDDYAAAYNRKKAEDLGQEEKERSDGSGGAYLLNTGPWDLEGSLTIEKGKPEDNDILITFLHEEQHAIKNIFYDRHSFDHFDLVKKDDAAKRRFVSRLISKRQVFEADVKNEILAYYKIGIIPGYLRTLFSPNGSYDFVGKWLNTFEAKFELKEAIDSGLSKEELAEVFFAILRDGYGNDIKGAVEVPFVLEKFGFGRDETIKLLGTEPLSRWPKVLFRMTEYDLEAEMGMREELLFACKKGLKFGKIKKYLKGNELSVRQKSILDRALRTVEDLRGKGLSDKDIAAMFQGMNMIEWPAAAGDRNPAPE